MSDLSNLLGDVYGDSTSLDGPPVRHEPAASERMPEFSEDSRLDRAFSSSWEPESPAANTDLASALSAALTAPAPAPVAPAPVAAAPITAPTWSAPTAPAPAPVAMAPVAVAAPASVRMWAPGDDDIFPQGKTVKAAKAGKGKKG